MSNDSKAIEILKTVWGKREDGAWEIQGLKGVDLRPQTSDVEDETYFPVGSGLQILTQSPGKLGVDGVFNSFGGADFLIKQSIVPVVLIVPDKNIINCIVTGFIISCTGIMITAGHVIIDPVESGYISFDELSGAKPKTSSIELGVIIPVSPATGFNGFRFFPIEWACIWGERKTSPLIHETDNYELLLDTAVCKIGEMPNDVAHQPLNLSLSSMSLGERAYAIGYAEMNDIRIRNENGKLTIPRFESQLFASVGDVISVHDQNHLEKEVPTPGPCFGFASAIPGKMSGGPIFGMSGAVVRGVVSRSISGEKHAFGVSIGPMSDAPVIGTETLRSMMESGTEGIPLMHGQGA